MKLKGFEEFLNESEGGGIMDQLPEKITTVQDVEDFILTLAKNDMIYHFDDSAADIIGSNGREIFTPEEAEKVDELMSQSFEVCQEHYKIEHGFWEGFIRGVWGEPGVIAFSADGDPVYLVQGGTVKKVSGPKFEEQVSTSKMEDGVFDQAWFDALPEA